MSIKGKFIAVAVAVCLTGCGNGGPANEENPNYAVAKALDLVTTPILPVVTYKGSNNVTHTVATLDCQNGVLMYEGGGAIDITTGPSAPQRVVAAREACTYAGYVPKF